MTDEPASSRSSTEISGSVPDSDPVKTLRAISSLRDEKAAMGTRRGKVAVLLKVHGRHLYCERCGVQGKIAQESKGKGKEAGSCMIACPGGKRLNSHILSMLLPLLRHRQAALSM